MPVSDYIPSVQEVATLLRARTRDANGNYVGTFDSTTLPTDTDATGLIELASDDVGEAIGPDIDTEFWDAAKVLVIYLAAANIELSYYPEQAAANNSMYDKLMERYNAKLEALSENIASEEESQIGDGDYVSSAPSGGFPMPIFWGYINW